MESAAVTSPSQQLEQQMWLPIALAQCVATMSPLEQLRTSSNCQCLQRLVRNSDAYQPVMGRYDHEDSGIMQVCCHEVG